MTASSTELLEAIRFGHFAEKGHADRAFGKRIVLEIKKALLAGKIHGGDPFPTIQKLSDELMIPAKSAFQVISILMSEGVLEIQEGVGSVIKGIPPPSPMQRSSFLSAEVEHFAVEARFLGLKEAEVIDALRANWM